MFDDSGTEDTIMDFEDGLDFLWILDGSLSFADLGFTQDGADTVIGHCQVV